MSKMSKETVQAKKDLNMSQPCKAPACGKNRRGFGAYCRYHEGVMSHWGWAQGKAIRRHEYAWSYTLVETFLTRNQEHPACQTALKWLAGFLNKPAMARVAKQGWQPMDLLIEACAMAHYFLEERPDLNEGHFMERSIGNALLRLASGREDGPDGTRRYIVPSKTTRKAVGKEVMQKLGSFFANVTTSIKADEIRKESARRALQIPIVSLSA